MDKERFLSIFKAPHAAHERAMLSIASDREAGEAALLYAAMVAAVEKGDTKYENFQAMTSISLLARTGPVRFMTNDGRHILVWRNKTDDGEDIAVQLADFRLVDARPIAGDAPLHKKGPGKSDLLDYWSGLEASGKDILNLTDEERAAFISRAARGLAGDTSFEKVIVITAIAALLRLAGIMKSTKATSFRGEVGGGTYKDQPFGEFKFVIGPGEPEALLNDVPTQGHGAAFDPEVSGSAEAYNEFLKSRPIVNITQSFGKDEDGQVRLTGASAISKPN